MTLRAIVAKRSVRILFVLSIGLAALMLFKYAAHDTSSKRDDERRSGSNDSASIRAASAPNRILGYRSTMLPGEVSATPVKDSMGMDMVPIFAVAGDGSALSAHARAMARVETVVVDRRQMHREIRVVGKVQYNETGLANITTRVEGYVERLFVDYTGIMVKPGDHLVEIYSPDLLVAQQELLLALESQHNTSLVESAQRKLLFWGLTQGQIDDLVRKHKVSDRITLFSPIRGTVIEKMVVREAMVKSGEMLYRLANLDSVWVYLDIYENELPWVQYGQTVDIETEALAGQRFSGRVWFISPVLNEETRTVKVLINISNTALKLKPGMYVSAVIRAQLLADGSPAPTGVEGQWSCPMHPHVVQARAGQCPICSMSLVKIPGTGARAKLDQDRGLLSVPVTAVLDSGIRKIVYVEKMPGEFSPVQITTGPRTDDAYPVLSGLQEGDNVAARGGFLLDSQLQIRGLPSLFFSEGKGRSALHTHAIPPATDDETRGLHQGQH
jgi:membrane fusion protein, copper/silver efflux system